MFECSSAFFAFDMAGGEFIVPLRTIEQKLWVK